MYRDYNVVMWQLKCFCSVSDKYSLIIVLKKVQAFKHYTVKQLHNNVNNITIRLPVYFFFTG